MTQFVPATLKKSLTTRFQLEYGDVSIDFTRFLWEKDDTFTLEFTVSQHGSLVAHYSGKAAYETHVLVLDIEAVERLC